MGNDFFEAYWKKRLFFDFNLKFGFIFKDKVTLKCLNALRFVSFENH